MSASLGSLILRVLTLSTHHPLPRKSKNMRATLKSNACPACHFPPHLIASVLEVLVRMLLNVVVLILQSFCTKFGLHNMYLCIGIDCLDKTTLIGVRDVPQSLVELRGAAAHVCSQRKCNHVRHATSSTKAGGSDARASLQCHKKMGRNRLWPNRLRPSLSDRLWPTLANPTFGQTDFGQN